MDVLSSFVVIALCGVVAFFLYLFSAGKITGGTGGTDGTGGTGGATVISPNLRVEQLDAFAKEVVESYIISVKEDHCWYISRPDAQGDIVLKRTTSGDREEDCAFTVSGRHAVIACDGEGLFIQDNESTNGMFLYGDPTPRDELPITENLLITLGDQPIRFTPLSRFCRSNGATRIKNTRKEAAPSVIRRKRSY